MNEVEKLAKAEALLYRWLMHDSDGDSDDWPYRDTWEFLDLPLTMERRKDAWQPVNGEASR